MVFTARSTLLLLGRSEGEDQAEFISSRFSLADLGRCHVDTAEAEQITLCSKTDALIFDLNVESIIVCICDARTYICMGLAY